MDGERMQVTLIGANGMPVMCACGNPASGWHLNTFGRQIAHCPGCDPAGPPCPLCEGSGHLPR